MKSRISYSRKQILSVTLTFLLTASLTTLAVAAGGGGIMPASTTHQVFAQTVGETSQAGEGQQTGANATTTEMTATEENEMYRWTVDGNINPPITLVANVNNTITVNNPTDTVHELVIAMAQGGEEGELAATMDVQPGGGQGELSIMPNATQALRYYCEYHPTTMLGDILITNATTMTNATAAAASATTMTDQT